MDRSSGPLMESVSAYGTSPDGNIVSWRIDLVDGQCKSVLKLTDKPGFNSDWSKFNVKTWFGYIRRDYTIMDPNVQIAWTLDGTEPQFGQEDKTVSAADYPFGTIISNDAPYAGNLQISGTIIGSGSIWYEIGRIGSFNKCEWIRFYEGTELVKEEIYMN